MLRAMISELLLNLRNLINVAAAFRSLITFDLFHEFTLDPVFMIL